MFYILYFITCNLVRFVIHLINEYCIVLCCSLSASQLLVMFKYSPEIEVEKVEKSIPHIPT